MVLREIEQRLKVADRLAACIDDPRDPGSTVHTVADIIRFRLLMIAAGYEDGNDADTRFIVTNLDTGSGRSLYQDLYCRRGQAENHIKAGKPISPPTTPRAPPRRRPAAGCRWRRRSTGR